MDVSFNNNSDFSCFPSSLEKFIEQSNKIKNIIVSFNKLAEIARPIVTPYIFNSSATSYLKQPEGIAKFIELAQKIATITYLFSANRIDYKKPKEVKLLNNKVVNSIPKATQQLCEIEGTVAEIEVSKKDKDNDKKANKQVIVIVEFSENEGRVLSRPINQFETNILSAVFTIFISGNLTFSPKHIYEILTGGGRAEKSPNLLAEIEKSIDRLKSIFVRIDATVQAKKQNYKIQKAISESYLLPLRKEKRIFKGKQQEEIAYEFIGIPAIFNYSQDVKQIVTCPTQLLQLSNASQELINLRIAVIKRVMNIATGSLKSNKILINSILEEAKITTEQSTQRKRYIKAIEKSLEEAKYQGYILDFIKLKKSTGPTGGRPSLNGFEIVVNKIAKKKK